MTAIILLNWNGGQDTIECLQSLYQCKGDYCVVVVDNGSTDHSKDEILDYLSKKGIRHSLLQEGQQLTTKLQPGECLFYALSQNYGFARGNNKALRLLSNVAGYDHYLLLNNDTIVDSNFLQTLADFASHHPEVNVLTPLIRYYSEPERIWNAGGSQFWGFRKYYHANQCIGQEHLTGHKKVSFLTGCALFFSPSVLQSDGSLLTERFFFGEEDFEFCLRMNAAKKNMACVFDAVVYHKVSMSVANMPSLGRIYIYYLNRFVDMRLHLSQMKYACWSRLYSVYVVALLKKKMLSWGDARRFAKLILRESRIKDGVSATDFLNAQKCSSVAELERQ
jgi:GT2 family glycosyltransferase